MSPPLLSLKNLSLTFGGIPLFIGAELSVSAGDRLCLVGRNGSGKSTLLKLAAGLMEPDRGERFLQPGTTICYLPQEPDLSKYSSILDYVSDGLAPGDTDQKAQSILSRLDLNGEAQTRYLSGGEARRAAIARVLAPMPDILLLDEPTNHLDLPTIEWLERELCSTRAAIVVISHDRRFLETLSQTTVWIDQAVCQRLARGYSDFEVWRDKHLEKEAISRHKLNNKILRETRWLERGVTARRKRNMGRMRALIKLREQQKTQRRSIGTLEMTAVESQRSGKRVIEAKEISKAFENNIIIDGFSTRILRGDRVGLIGPNGVGKTTLLKVITGELSPDKGTIELGANIDLVTLDQKRESLSPTTCLADALTGKSGDSVNVAGQQKHVISYMQDFLFEPAQARTPISALSGGERGRLMLARAFTQPSNLLVLDEPTNDLDLETLDLLQELLAEYLGTVIIVSHDREFLDRVVTSVIVSEGNGKWIEYPGGYTDMSFQRKKALGQESLEVKSQNLIKQRKQNKRVKKVAVKLSYKEQYLLETLPEQMKNLQREIDQYHSTLAEDQLFLENPTKFQAAAEGLDVAKAKLEEAEERWLNLEIRRDEIKGR